MGEHDRPRVPRPLGKVGPCHLARVRVRVRASPRHLARVRARVRARWESLRHGLELQLGLL